MSSAHGCRAERHKRNRRRERRRTALSSATASLVVHAETNPTKYVGLAKATSEASRQVGDLNDGHLQPAEVRS